MGAVALKFKAGETLKLSAQETGGDGTKVMRVDLYNMADWSVLASNILLTHIANGAYENNTGYTAPSGIQKIYALTKVFDADGVTPNSTGEHTGFDIFELDNVASEVLTGLASATREADFVATIDESELIASIEADNINVAELESDEIDAVIEIDEELVATNQSSELTAILEC